ncbi:Transcription factor bHLH148 [Striga hermonthica]|uniref:Transcription factor bHLH148 n=1 Tax=Striga hermonthica TaxID=68872 RepID=A0A9N7NP18_STRHE|nr:Transcription factor bHLH148 [Striga hermonthica]
MISSNPAADPDRLSTRMKKRKKTHNQTQNRSETVNPEANPRIEWKSDAQERIYLAKLHRVLQQARREGGPRAASYRRVHEAANRVLAVTARGRSRWSRTVLTSRLTVKFAKKMSTERRQRRVMTVITGGSGSIQRNSKGIPAFQSKVGVLGRLVPGCGKQSLPVVLEEAADYIAALEMQVD